MDKERAKMNKYKFIDSFNLKLIAIIAMTVDHTGALFFKGANLWLYLFMRTVGAVTFPVMAFMITQGFLYTKNFNKYALRLFLFSLASMIPYAFAFGKSTYGLNVGFTLLLGLFAVKAYEDISNRILKWTAVFFLVVLSFKCDWGFTGVFLIVFLHIAGENKKNIILAMCGGILMFILKNQAALFIEKGRFFSFAAIAGSVAFLRLAGFFISAGLIFLYNKEKGKDIKQLFYIYYPAHLFVLALIRYAPAIMKHIL